MYEHTVFYLMLTAAFAGLLSLLYHGAEIALAWLNAQGISTEFTWWALLVAAGCAACLWAAERVKK